ncbi:hypothetical protein PSPO01_15851 [Paraphaeosphaeria sporulosa]
MIVAAFDARVIFCSLLANFVGLSCRGRISSPTVAKSTRRDARWPVGAVAATSRSVLMLL